MSLQRVQGRIALEDLRLVQAIAEAGTLSGAAQRLRVDHSTAFRRLNALEDRLGVRLFLRGRDGYTPTPAVRWSARRRECYPAFKRSSIWLAKICAHQA